MASTLPALLVLGGLLGALLGFNTLPMNEGGAHTPWFDTLWTVASLVGAPCLLLWVLLNIQRSERARTRVVLVTSVLCICMLPLLVGLILAPPLLLCVLLLALRRSSASS